MLPPLDVAGSMTVTAGEHPLSGFLRDLMDQVRLALADREAVLALPYKLRRLDPGTYLVREGSVPSHCGVLVNGFAFRQKTTGQGARQIMAVCVPGDAVDLQNMFLEISDHAVQMLVGGIIADVPRPALQDLVLTRPDVGRAIIQLTLIEASILREWVVNVGRRDARERIAHILCEFAVRLESRGLNTGSGFELPMTQEQLADATGLTPVHVNRVLKGLEAEGLISRQRRHIQYPDWRALQTVGDFTRTYLHIPGEDAIQHAY